MYRYHDSSNVIYNSKARLRSVKSYKSIVQLAQHSAHCIVATLVHIPTTLSRKQACHDAVHPPVTNSLHKEPNVSPRRSDEAM